MRRVAPCLALALAFTLPALAADDEPGRDFNDGYRKGYNDGFTAGYRKAMDERARAAPPPAAPPPPPRATGPITVSTAYYGTSSKSCDATRFVARRANGRVTASVDVSNEICGDPARGDRKQLEVTYVCGSIAKTASAYEHRTVYLDCTS